MSDLDLTRDWVLLLSLLPVDYEDLAKQHGQVETKFGNAKITCARDLLRFFFLHVGAGLPLRQTVALIEEAGGPSLSPMRLHMKLRHAEPYLHALVTRLCGLAGGGEPERWGGYEMVAVDATVLCGPASKGVDARLHTCLRLSDLAIVQANVTGDGGGETFRNFAITPGQLWLGDRIYSNPPGIAWVLDHGGDVLVRYNRGALPLLDSQGASLDVLKELDSVVAGSPAEHAVAFDVGEKRIAARLVIDRLPPHEAERSRARLRKEQGASHVSTAALKMAGYIVLLTTADARRMPTERCLRAYRLRWQVELLYKRWKSLGGLDRVPNKRRDTLVSWLYVKLLLALLIERLGSAEAEPFPPWQLATVVRPPRKPRRSRARAATVEGRHDPVGSADASAGAAAAA
ncbi:MAG: transposase [Byssovorax sp.]